MRRSHLLSIPLVAGLLVVGACGDDDHDDGSVPQTGNRPTETTVATTSTTLPPETTLPVSPEDSTPEALPDEDADDGSTTTTPGGDGSTTTTVAPGTETTTTVAP
jgi:hypothetical protein